jgi:hypothetical protein
MSRRQRKRHWLAAAPAELRAHLDLALGHRTAAVVATVLEALDAGGPGDEHYQDKLFAGPGYALPEKSLTSPSVVPSR